MFAGTKNRFGTWLVLAEGAVFVLITFLAIPALAGNSGEKPWYTGFAPILILLGAIALVFWRLPEVKEEYKGQLAHLKVKGFRFRRAINWLLLGTTYAFLYWGRYNLQPAVQALGGEKMIANFNLEFFAGTFIYGLSFIINGPLTDRFGGRFSIILGGCGAAIVNLLMGTAIWLNQNGQLSANGLFWSLVILFSVNMYFQSFGAVAIVKCNSAWFHVRERGAFGAIFGILISLGIYFAFDWSYSIIKDYSVSWAFFAPAAALGVTFVLNLFIVRNKPSEAGLQDFNTDDASAGDNSERQSAYKVFVKMAKKRKVIVEERVAEQGKVVVRKHEAMMYIILIIAGIEFCSGFLRQAIMQQYRFFVKTSGSTGGFVYDNWGLVLCVAGILGGVFAGTISDRVFNSRRGPVAVALYIGMLAGTIGMFCLLGYPELGWVAAFMSLCVMGVHGMLSGTASMDFGGTKNVGIAVGLIDGFVYLGSATQSFVYAHTLPKGGDQTATVLSNWITWPMFMIPFAIIGLFLAYQVRNVKPKPKNEEKH